MSNTYEQICIKDSDVMKTVFATIYGTFVSYVIQQGDCNALSTFQRFMVYIFRDYVGRFIHIFLDNIFIFSMCLEDHERHPALVFERLRINHSYLSAKKVNLYSIRMDCLGFIINNEDIFVDSNKMQLITSWCT